MTTDEGIEETATSDGGCRGWLVVAASFIVHAVTIGSLFTYGLIVPSLVDQFDCGRALVGGVASLCVGLSWIAGAFTLAVRNQGTSLHNAVKAL